MWITTPSIRSAFSLASGCSMKDFTPDLDSWASEAERSCSLNGKPTRSQSWKQGCKKAPYLLRLSGLAISANSMQSSFSEWWIASLVASRAKTSASPADALGLTASAAASSLKSAALPTIAVRGSSFWRTSQASLLPPPPLWTRPKANLTNAQPPASWENWPTVGGMRSGSLFQRPVWAPAMGGNGGFAWRGGMWKTAKASDSDHGGPNMRDSSGSMMLPSQAAHWATPDCNTSTYSNGKMGPNIREQASNWPTPNAHVIEHKSKPPILDGTRKPSDPQISIADIAVHHFSHQAQPTQPGRESSSNGPTLPRRLNPTFVSWLMGWPTTWVIAAPSASSAAETALWRSKLRQQLCCLFPDQCDNFHKTPDKLGNL